MTVKEIMFKIMNKRKEAAMGYGAFLKEQRQKQGLSLRAVAEIAGLSFVTIKSVEDGQNSPTFDTLVGILNALGVPFQDFLKAAGYTAPRKPYRVGTRGFEPRTSTVSR